jgi:hypothetical protein
MIASASLPYDIHVSKFSGGGAIDKTEKQSLHYRLLSYQQGRHL